MVNREVALSFVELFCAGDLEGLESILSDQLSVKGPYLSTNSRQDYLEALNVDPPVKAPFRILSVSEGDDGQVAIFWEYLKEQRPVTIGQLFTIRRHQVVKVLLVFDAR